MLEGFQVSPEVVFQLHPRQIEVESGSIVCGAKLHIFARGSDSRLVIEEPQRGGLYPLPSRVFRTQSLALQACHDDFVIVKGMRNGFLEGVPIWLPELPQVVSLRALQPERKRPE
jgi:hypothetical protein